MTFTVEIPSLDSSPLPCFHFKVTSLLIISWDSEFTLLVFLLTLGDIHARVSISPGHIRKPQTKRFLVLVRYFVDYNAILLHQCLKSFLDLGHCVKENSVKGISLKYLQIKNI